MIKTSMTAAVLAAAATLLTACGSDDKPATSGSSAAASPSDSPAAENASGNPSGDASGKPKNGSQGSSGGQAPAATGKAVKLAPTQEALLAMPDLYFESVSSQFPKAKRNMVVGPKNILFGKVPTAKGTFSYAVADMSLKGFPLSAQDGPHVWRRGADTDWEYVGDTGGNLCPQVPAALVKVWGKTCN